MKNNAKVCVSCVGDTHIPENEFTIKYESAVVFGTAKEVSDENEKTNALRLLCLRYTYKPSGRFKRDFGHG